MSVHHICSASERYERMSCPQKVSYRKPWAVTWVLRSSGRAARALNCWATCPAQSSFLSRHKDYWLSSTCYRWPFPQLNSKGSFANTKNPYSHYCVSLFKSPFPYHTFSMYETRSILTLTFKILGVIWVFVFSKVLKLAFVYAWPHVCGACRGLWEANWGVWQNWCLNFKSSQPMTFHLLLFAIYSFISFHVSVCVPLFAGPSC